MVTEFFTLGVDSLVFNIGKAGDQVVQTCWDGFADDCSWQIVRVSLRRCVMVSLLDCMQLKFDWMVGPLHGPIVLRLYWCLDSGVEITESSFSFGVLIFPYS